MKPLRVLSLLPVVGQPRHSKRIAMLRSEGFEVKAAAFTRPYHRGRMPDCDIVFLGQIQHGRYVSRAIKMMSVLPVLRRLIRDADIVYASGPDLGALAQVAGIFLKKPTVIEIGDIQPVQVSTGIFGWVVRLIETVTSRHASLLVSTADAFVSEYYRKRLRVSTPALVIENKLEPGTPPVSDVRRTSGLTIGYFGLLRCRTSWEILEALAIARPSINILVAGKAVEPTDIVERIGRLPNVEWFGEYKSPQDLQHLYGRVDMMLAYQFPDPGGSNWRWSRTNRFYESCHFHKPLITCRGSGDGKAVREYDIGIEIGVDSIQDNVCTISSISNGQIERWSQNMRKLAPSVYTYTNEPRLLGEALAKIVDRPVSS